MEDEQNQSIYIRTGWGAFIKPVQGQKDAKLTPVKTVAVTAVRTNMMATALVKMAELPVTCVFRTDPGLIGYMKITRLSNGENGVDVHYGFVTVSRTNALFPLKEDALTSPPNGSKPIPLEAANLFNQYRELQTALSRNIRSQANGSPASDSAIESARQSLQMQEIRLKLASLTEGTPFEGARWNRLRASRQMEQVDPNKEREKWNQFDEKMYLAQLQEERLMVEAGAGDPLQPRANELQFGPWVEATVLHPSAGRDCFIDFDSGRLLTPPPAILASLPAKDKPGSDIFEAMPEEVGWLQFHLSAADTNAVAGWIMESGADAVELAPGRLVLFCPIQTDIPIADLALNPGWEQQNHSGPG